MKGFPEFLLKKQKGPVETKNKPSRKEIEKSFEIGEKLENFDTPSDIIDYQMKTKSPAKQKAKTGHGAKGFPDTVSQIRIGLSEDPSLTSCFSAGCAGMGGSGYPGTSSSA